MMKALFFVVFCMAILAGVAYSSYIEVGINGVMKGNAISIMYDNTTNIAKFSTEFFNTGSVGYSARSRVEIYDNDTLLFIGWSQQKDLTPGERKTFDLYWYTNETKNYGVVVRMYYGNEIADYDKFNVTLGRSMQRNDSFEIYNFRTYDDHVIFDIRSSQDATGVVIMPSRYTYGWIFEQKELGNMSNGDTRTVVLKYYPSLWAPGPVNIMVASDGGRLYTQRTLDMKKESGLTGILLSIFDSIRMIFS
jgi:hypothetical protein